MHSRGRTVKTDAVGLVLLGVDPLWQHAVRLTLPKIKHTQQRPLRVAARHCPHQNAHRLCQLPTKIIKHTQQRTLQVAARHCPHQNAHRLCQLKKNQLIKDLTSI